MVVCVYRKRMKVGTVQWTVFYTRQCKARREKANLIYTHASVLSHSVDSVFVVERDQRATWEIGPICTEGMSTVSWMCVYVEVVTRRTLSCMISGAENVLGPLDN